MEGETDRASRQQDALRKILLRQKLRLWASKAHQERADLAEELVQLFTSSALSSSSSSSSSSVAANGTTTTTTNGEASLVARPITRRPGVEEVRNCVLSAAYPCIPPSCESLRGEVWQVLLNVYKRNQHGAAAQEFERMIARLSKLPRDPLLVEECDTVSRLLCADNEDDGNDAARAQIQSDLEILLVWFLTTKSVEYERGMARVVGVFFSLHLPLPTVYDCFYQFCATFLPHFVNNNSSFDVTSMTSGMAKLSGASASESDSDLYSRTQHETSSSHDGDTSAADPNAQRLQRKRRERQQLVEQLLSYHNPQLAHFLNQWCPNGWSEPGDLIPEELFLDDTYNVISPKSFVHIMDQYLLTGDLMFGVFVIVATLIGAQDRLTTLHSREEVAKQVKLEFATAIHDGDRMQFVCMLASRLRGRTPTSYKIAQLDAKDSFCASRQAMEIAFNETSLAKTASSQAKADVDMSQWQKRESRSFAGKIFWYHTPTGRTQWEHPAENSDPAPALFALPIGVEEVAGQVMGEKRFSATNDGSVGLRFFVVDCRGLRSSEDLKSGKIPAAYTLDPCVFDSPELIERSMAALDAMKSQVHIVLVGDGVGVPPELIKSEELKTTVRDAVRHDADCMNRAALFFQKRGFRFISCLDGGYSSWHAFMRDDPACSPHELLCHVEDECHHCRYDTIVRTGEDPRQQKKKAQAKTRRKKSAMPTTTTMLVNGGEGDASIVSTNEAAVQNPRPPGRRSLTTSLSLTRTSITNMNTSISSMRSKLSMPKLGGWRRSNSATSSNQNDSSSETATAEDGGSDRGSLTNDETESHRILEESVDGEQEGEGEATQTVAAAAAGGSSSPSSPKKEPKNFVGVFTIDYSDDEEDEEFSAENATKSIAAVNGVASAASLPSAAAPMVAATQSA